MKREVKLKKYNTAEKILASYWGISVKDYLESTEGIYKFKNKKGKNEIIPSAKIVEATKGMGYWGYTDPKKRVLHYWISKENPPTIEELAFFFGHEVGHMTGKQIKSKGKSAREMAKEEERANGYGESARKTYEILKSLGFLSPHPRGIKNMSKEHYEAQQKYAKLLFEMLEINRWLHPIKSYRAFIEAEKFRDSHRKCCEWANEKD